MSAEPGLITAVVSEQVIAETERVVARKVPRALLPTVGLSAKQGCALWETHSLSGYYESVSRCPCRGCPILVTAMDAGGGLSDDAEAEAFCQGLKVARLSGLRIGLPGDALARVRS